MSGVKTTVHDALTLKGKSYIIQQGINIYKFFGQITYVRTIAQRGADGTLHGDGLAIRVGGKSCLGGLTQNLKTVTDVLEQESEISSKVVRKRIRNASLNTFLAIEKVAQTTIGELAMDIVFDRRGKVYVLEANVKPGTLVFKKRKDYIKRVFIDPRFKEVAIKMEYEREARIIEYAKYLHQNHQNND